MDVPEAYKIWLKKLPRVNGRLDPFQENDHHPHPRGRGPLLIPDRLKFLFQSFQHRFWLYSLLNGLFWIHCDSVVFSRCWEKVFLGLPRTLYLRIAKLIVFKDCSLISAGLNPQDTRGELACGPTLVVKGRVVR